MQNLFRRPSGIYVLRLTVPSHLRQVFGKREIVTTTGTTELTVAKMVAGALAAQWRQRIFEAGRLLSQSSISSMDHQEILRVARGHPSLLSGGHLSLLSAALASGISTTDLLRAAADGRLSLFVRGGNVRGFLLPFSELALDDPSMGTDSGRVVPAARHMPESAVEFIGVGMLKILASDLPAIAAKLIVTGEVAEVVMFELADRPGMVFAPNEVVIVKPESLEVAASEVELIRKAVASSIEPDRIKEARALEKAALHGAQTRHGTKSQERLSVALDAYIKNRVRQDVAAESEIKRIRNGCALLIELEGDLPLADVSAEKLRSFRDKKLSRVPADENKIRLIYRSRTVAESMKVVEGKDWPTMSVAEREKRMRWISAWFRWMHTEQKWISENPAASLRRESVLTKAERRKMKSSRRADEARDTLTENELKAIFSAPWFKSGRGQLTKQGTYRTFSPFRYWLPLLGLFTGGGRISELCQLHLNDIRQAEDGTWYVDINDDTEDKTLKTDWSRRKVPLHQALLDLGFDKWLAALHLNGYTRVFPELKRDPDKGYGAAATKWFTTYMASLGIPRDGKKVFHSFRHTYTNALPEETPDRIRRQLTGHARGKDIHDTTYRKDVDPAVAAQYVQRLAIKLPPITTFDIEAGLAATKDALRRKNRGHGANEDVGET